jgi:hypothetical protein
MAKAFTQVPPDSTGDKLRMRSMVDGADTVNDQGVFIAALPSYLAVADAIVPAANKHFISLFNNSGTNQTVYLQSLKLVNLSIAAVTGVMLRFEVRRTTAQSAGTAVTPVLLDTRNPALSGILCATGATITDGALLKPVIRNSDEHTAAVGNVYPLIEELNLLEQNDGGQSYTLRPGEGITLKQVTSSTVGSFAALLKFSVEPD